MSFCTIRERANISQKELAERVGVTQAAISHWERGSRQPRVDMAVKIAKELNCTVDELLRGEA